MFQHKGIWLPDGETGLVEQIDAGPLYAGKGTYQFRKLICCLPFIRNFGQAIDIGAHVGTWTRVLCTMFEKVAAFEPYSKHFECLKRNAPDAETHNVALGAVKATSYINLDPANSGGAHIWPEGEKCNVWALDDMNFDAIDFIKIDVEGYELPVVRGAEKNIRKHKPVIIIEQKNHAGRYRQDNGAALKLLGKWGAEVETQVRGDYILRWR